MNVFLTLYFIHRLWSFSIIYVTRVFQNNYKPNYLVYFVVCSETLVCLYHLCGKPHQVNMCSCTGVNVPTSWPRVSGCISNGAVIPQNWYTIACLAFCLPKYTNSWLRLQKQTMQVVFRDWDIVTTKLVKHQYTSAPVDCLFKSLRSYNEQNCKAPHYWTFVGRS